MTIVKCPPTVPPSIAVFLKAFYEASDANPSSASVTDSTNEAYANFFTDAPTFHMGPVTANDKAGIKEWRKGGWEGITSRRHIMENVYLLGKLSDDDERAEFMVYGTVDYGVKDGGKGTADWGARLVLNKQGKEWKMSFYQVYIVSGILGRWRQLTCG